MDDISTYFYDLPQSNKRRNRYIYPSAKSGSLRIHNLAETLDRSSFPSSPDSFVYSGWCPCGLLQQYVVNLEPPTDDAKKHLVTIFVVADLDEESGLGIVKEALSSIVSLIPRSRELADLEVHYRKEVPLAYLLSTTRRRNLVPLSSVSSGGRHPSFLAD